MTTNKTIDNNYKAAKLIFAAFVMFTVISYLYVLITGTYNGDYLDRKPQLSQGELFLCFIYTVLPFFVLFGIYKFFKSSHNTYKISIPVKPLGQFLLFLLIFQIITTYLYGVGRLTKEIYDAPAWIKIFIQIFNRFSPFWGTFLYIIVAKKENRFQYLFLFLCIILSFLRASLMIFVLISFFLFIQHYEKIVGIVKRRFLWVILGVIIFPTITAMLYDYRDSLRRQEQVTHSKMMSSSRLLFGKLAGRLSSFSSTAILMEREGTVTKLLNDNNVSPFQYSKEALRVFYGKIIGESELLYMNVMLESEGKQTKIVSYMAGTQGSLMIAWYNSGFSFVVTLLTILIIVFLTFFLVSFFNYDGVQEIVFLFFCVSVMSGVAGEYMEQLMNFLLYAGFFLIINSLSIRKKA